MEAEKNMNENKQALGIDKEALKEIIETKKLQVELQELNTKFVEAKVRELVALSQMSQLKANPADFIEHKLTEEDFKNNPDLKEQNFKVGDVIGIPKEEIERFKSNNPLSVVKD